MYLSFFVLTQNVQGIEPSFEDQYRKNGSEGYAGSAEHQTQTSTDVLQAHPLQEDAKHIQNSRCDQAEETFLPLSPFLGLEKKTLAIQPLLLYIAVE